MFNDVVPAITIIRLCIKCVEHVRILCGYARIKVLCNPKRRMSAPDCTRSGGIGEWRHAQRCILWTWQHRCSKMESHNTISNHLICIILPQECYATWCTCNCFIMVARAYLVYLTSPRSDWRSARHRGSQHNRNSSTEPEQQSWCEPSINSHIQ